MTTKFSIIILTKNSIGVIERLVDSLLKQDFEPTYEVIFMDNNSTDHTVEYLKQTPFQKKRIIHVPEGEFSHSLTRMKGAEAAEGKYVIFFTDDIIPISRQFLTNLVEPIISNKSKAAYGVYQIDPNTSDPVDAFLHNDWYKGFDEVMEPISAFYWHKFSPEMKRRFCNFDNCSSCIDKKLLLDLKFPNVPYGEDMLFAKKMILNNHSIAISKNARFFHWHKVSFTYLLKRMCVDQYLSIDEFGIYYIRRKIGVLKENPDRRFYR